MKITNQKKLPQTIVRALERDDYDAGDSDITVTQLINPPQLEVITREHQDEITEDAADMLWAFYGKAVHYVIEHAADANSIAEKRFFSRVNGWNLSGQVDLIENDNNKKSLNDFKLTSIWTIKDALANGNAEWEAQLNVLDWLCYVNGMPIDELYIIAMARDWSEAERKRFDGYPKQITKIKIPRWNIEDQDLYIRNAIEEHKDARGGRIRPCTDEERWMKPQKFALMRRGRQTALKLENSVDELLEYAHAHDLAGKNSQGGFVLKDKLYIDERPKEYARCARYCPAAPWCPQFRGDKQWKLREQK